MEDEETWRFVSFRGKVEGMMEDEGLVFAVVGVPVNGRSLLHFGQAVMKFLPLFVRQGPVLPSRGLSKTPALRIGLDVNRRRVILSFQRFLEDNDSDYSDFFLLLVLRCDRHYYY